MRVFVTGASGWIGSAVVPELIGAGHEVVGLARSDASAAALAAAGVHVERGDLDDLDTLRTTAEKADGVIHLAFKHDLAFTGDFEGAATADRQAVEGFGEGLAGWAPALATPASWPPWWRSPGTRASRGTRPTGPTAGPPCTGSIRRPSSAWPSR